MKVYRTDASALDLFQQRREMAALTALRHAGLVALLDGGVEPGPTGGPTSCVDGPTLSARPAEGPLRPAG